MYVALEGIDEVGKSSIIKELNKFYNKHNPGYCITIKEPVNDNFDYFTNVKDDRYRSILLNDAFAIDRLKNDEIIKTAKLEDKLIISDRSVFSSLAYQGVHLDKELILNANSECVFPDLFIFIDTGISKVMSRNKDLDLMFLGRVRLNYLDLCEEYDSFIVDGNNSLNHIIDDVKLCIASAFKKMYFPLEKMSVINDE